MLAESVFDGVKAKMRNLRAALADKESMLQAMTQVGQADQHVSCEDVDLAQHFRYAQGPTRCSCWFVRC